MPNLTTVTLPAGLTGIPKDAFANSTKLATVKFGTADANTPSARKVTGDDNAITLPSGITSIGDNAFAGTAATTVDLSKITAANFTTIGENVFRGMTNLAEVKLPASITTIGNNAFQGDAALKTLSQDNPKQARDETTPTTGTATFGKSLISIGQNAFNGTGFSTVDLSAATGTPASGGNPSTPATPLSVGSGAFTNMPELTTVKLPGNADINPAYFGNPADAAGTAKLASITYGDSSSSSSSLATITLNDATISSLNFSKIKNQVIEIKSSVGGSTINFSGGVFNGNDTMTTLKLSVTATNGNNPL